MSTEMPKDDFICMKMMTRYNQLRQEHPQKPRPDVGWMSELLDVARSLDGFKPESKDNTLPDQILKLLKSHATGSDEYTNPNFLQGVVELLDEYYQIGDGVVEDWIRNMWER